MMEYWIKTGSELLGNIIDGVSALIIAHATLLAAWLYLRSSFRSSTISRLDIRLSLGKSLAVALEFLLAADVLRTAVAPGWDDIGKLAAIAALRTILNYFLEREMKHSESPL